jgi:aminoglycoside phosphotransferase (APT) family kinase protein
MSFSSMISDTSEIRQYLTRVFGNSCELEKIEVFEGGARKQVFFLDLKEPALRCVMYLWHDIHHYFSERDNFDAIQSDERAPLLFKVNTEMLESLEVNVPKLYFFGQLKAEHHFAFVEYVSAKNFTTFSASASPDVRVSVLERTGAMLRRLNSAQRSYPGTVLDAPTQNFKQPYEVMLERTLLELNVTVRHHADVAKYQEAIEHKLRTFFTQLKPRNFFQLIHGELGPEHILIRPQSNTPCFVDVDGAQFNDVEMEHALLSFRFGDDYNKYLGREGLETARLDFYRFALHVSLVYAGAKFLAKDFHDHRLGLKRFLTII